MATLESKVILIIGGSSGIGYGVAEAALISHAALVIIASSNASHITEAVQKLESAQLGSGKVRGEVVDARDAKTIEALFARVGEIDHLVWTSGDIPNAPFPVKDLENAKAAFDVRFWGAVLAAQFAKFRPGGSITLTAGAALLKPPKGAVVGVGMAGAVDALTRGLAVDLAPVRVNLISPGYVDTPLLKKLSQGPRERMVTDGVQKLLLKRVATPAEIAEAYLFVMKCSYITGQRIDVDGGFVLGA